MTMTLSGDGTITGLVAGGLPDATITTDELAAGAALNNAPNSVGFRNRIINGDMRIDQRNAGAAVTSSNYVTDRFAFFENGSMAFSVQQSTTAPAGFVNSFAVTVSTAASPSAATRSQVYQGIEGNNVADLGWGTANAKTVTLSFWVRSSLTGTFGGAIQNISANRSYPYTYTISAADTWEYKTVTIAGDTTGTWPTNNNFWGQILWDIGMGSDLLGTAGVWAAADYRGATGGVKLAETLNATWYITGVQLEVGSVATPFERRPYGTELALCQRYFEKSYNTDVAVTTNTEVGMTAWLPDATQSYTSRTSFFAATKRATPTVVIYSKQGTAAKFNNLDTGTELNAATIRNGMSCLNMYANNQSVGASVSVGYHWTASSEL